MLLRGRSSAKRLLTLLLTLGALATLTACGQGTRGEAGEGVEEGTPDTQQQPAEEDTGGPGSVGGERTVQVDMKDIKFVPKEITVPEGSSVEWKNSDPFPHTVTKTGGVGRSFDSGNIAQGKNYSQTFTTEGKIDYVCTIHPGQTGTIQVVATQGTNSAP